MKPTLFDAVRHRSTPFDTRSARLDTNVKLYRPECRIALNKHQIVPNERRISVEHYSVSFDTIRRSVRFDGDNDRPKHRSKRRIALNRHRMASNGVKHGAPR